MVLFELRVEIPVATVEAVDERFQEMGVEGWTLLQNAIEQRAWIVGIFPLESEARHRWEELKPTIETVGQITLRELPDQDWRESYKAHFHAWRFGSLHWVPVWERETYDLPAGDQVIWLDPGLAFGTGNHETTRLCCERLVAYARSREDTPEGRRGQVMDAGCGSGILALSAAKLGFRDVEGFDNDPEAIRVSLENAALNGLEGSVPFAVADLESGLLGRQASLLMANIQADVLLRFASHLIAAVAPQGHLVLSGILAQERDHVWDAFRALVPQWQTESRIMGEWSDILLIRPGG